MIEHVAKGLAADRDAQERHVGEVRQSHPARFMHLPEDHILLGAVQHAPGPDPPFQCAPDTRREFGMAAQHLFEDGHRPQSGRFLQERHDFGIEDGLERIGPPALPRLHLL